MSVNQVLFRYENVASVFILFFGMLECCSLHLYPKIAKSVMKLSNSGLQKPMKLSKFCIFLEMLTSAKVFAKIQCLIKKTEVYFLLKNTN